MFEAVGYCEASRHLYVKCRNGQVRCFENVPHFRIQGILNSPRKDGYCYFKSYLQNSFLSNEAKLPGATLKRCSTRGVHVGRLMAELQRAVIDHRQFFFCNLDHLRTGQ